MLVNDTKTRPETLHNLLQFVKYSLYVKKIRGLQDFLTSIYRKPTLTGQYIRWNSFEPKSRKTKLIGTLVHRALIIRSPSKLFYELDSIRSILSFYGYPDRVMDLGIKKL